MLVYVHSFSVYLVKGKNSGFDDDKRNPHGNLPLGNIKQRLLQRKRFAQLSHVFIPKRREVIGRLVKGSDLTHAVRQVIPFTLTTHKRDSMSLK